GSASRNFLSSCPARRPGPPRPPACGARSALPRPTGRAPPSRGPRDTPPPARRARPRPPPPGPSGRVLGPTSRRRASRRPARAAAPRTRRDFPPAARAPAAARHPAPDRAGDRTAAVLASFLLLPVCQQYAQPATRVEHLRAHGALGDAEDARDLGVRVALHVEQHDRHATPVRQLGERRPQSRRQGAPLRGRTGAGAARDERGIELLDPARRAAGGGNQGSSGPSRERRRRSTAYRAQQKASPNVPTASVMLVTRGNRSNSVPSPANVRAAVKAIARRSPPATRRSATTATA